MILMLCILDFENTVQNFNLIGLLVGAKGDWDFQISDLFKSPDGTDI